MATIYVHCGFHKTGSTAIQQALCEHSVDLRDRKILYPETGRVGQPGGHHNIAWQLATDRRFRRSAGDLGDLFEEVASFDGDVVLSSEDFESSISSPRNWLPFLSLARSHGRTIKLVVYIRNQTAYLESLFLEMLRHGFGDDFLAFAHASFAYGVLRWKEWQFHFDYYAVATIWFGVPDVSIMFRNYHDLRDGSPTSDFASVIGLKSGDIFCNESNERINARDTAATSLKLFYQNRTESPLTDAEAWVIDELFDESASAVKVKGPLREAFTSKFSRSNARVCDQFALSSTGLLPTVREADEMHRTRDIQRVFSLETQSAILDMASIFASAPPEARAEASRQLERRIQDLKSRWL